VAEFTKEEYIHMLLGINALSFKGTCDHCDSAAKKIQEELVKLYEVPAETIMLVVPEEYKKLGVVSWEKTRGKDDE
jgi:hypothetical protein